MGEKQEGRSLQRGCAVCDDAIAKVREWACPSCDVIVLDMKDAAVADYAAGLGVSFAAGGGHRRRRRRVLYRSRHRRGIASKGGLGQPTA